MCALRIGVLVLFLNLLNVLSMQFDVNYPIIYNDPYKEMKIERDKSSYFGYSIVLYGGDEINKAWVQIGAPRGNNLNHPVYNPGTIFKCEIWGNCTMIDIDTDYGRSTYNGIRIVPKKDEMWMGNVMDINTEFNVIIVCGYRWTNHVKLPKKIVEYCPEGACYWSTINGTKYEKLLPLIDPDKFSGPGYKFYNYAMGEAGFSAHLTNSKTNAELLIGAPNVYNWKGTTLIYKTLYTNETNNYTIPSLVIADSAEIKAFGNKYQLFGYAVTSGYYFNQNKLLYVASAPKNDYLGIILVYNFHKHSNMGLDITDQKVGEQFGEYFGASLASGDLNNDGLTDLVVGAPYYKRSQYNEGRVYIYLGHYSQSLQVPTVIPKLTGKVTNGQFGLSVAFLGDIDIDGYGDIAIGAPYENDQSGVVYIYRGCATGISAEPSQIIAGKSIDINLKGFGYSFSKPADIDNNKYHDLAIGAYLSGHTIIFRNRPIVKLRQKITSYVNILYPEQQFLDVGICLWYTGMFLPSSILVTRKIIVDKRTHLHPKHNNEQTIQVYLTQQQFACSNYTIILKENIDYVPPITVSVFQEIIEENQNKLPIYIGVSNDDRFCKTCPIPTNSTTEITVPFALKCRNNNICKSNLLFDTTFSNVKNDSIYIIGSAKYITLTIKIVNVGENAYSTNVIVELPKNVSFRRNMQNCTSSQSQHMFNCPVENPLMENDMKIISFEINMNLINDKSYTGDLIFNISVETSSENINKMPSKEIILSLRTEADIALTGSSGQESYPYRNIKLAKSVLFTQTYLMTKSGKSPINQVSFYLKIPISISTDDYLINFLKVESHKSVLPDNSINCVNLTNIDYIKENDLKELEGILDPNEILDPPSLDVIPLQKSNDDNKLLRKRRENLIHTNNLNDSSVHVEDGLEPNVDTLKLPKNRTFIIDCSTIGVNCATVKCTAGPFKKEQRLVGLKLTAHIDVSALEDVLSKKDIVVYSSEANISFTVNDIDKQYKLNRIDTVFLGELPIYIIETWIYIVTILGAFFILFLIIFALIKAGFFTREKKLELEELKKADNKTKPTTPTKLCFIDFQLTRLGSPALDLSYFIFTCTDKKLRDEHYEEMLKTYYASLTKFLKELSCDVEDLFPYSILLQHMKKFSIYGLMMTIMVTHLMLSETDEIPDLEKTNVDGTIDVDSAFGFQSKNEEVYHKRMRDVVLDFVAKEYI